MIRNIIVGIILCLSSGAFAGADSITAINRTNAENYKDRALAACIATAYKGSSAGDDADITTSAFIEWTYYDVDKGNQATDQLVEKYLHRDYTNPLEGYAAAKFNLLKCLDMYHSGELNEQVHRYVPHPDWVGDKPAEIDPAKGCKNNPAVIGKCFNVRGRIAVYNGSPVVRILLDNSKNVLGVLPSEHEIMPTSLKKLVNPDQDVFANMTVCPFSKFKPGNMQFVCIEDAKNIRSNYH